MKEAIESKIFREDLFYRLNVVPIQLAPLRERKEDIIPLAEYFLEQLSKTPKTFSSEAKQVLLHYPWPGNIRQLANIIERTTVMTTAEVILPEHLGLEPVHKSPAPITTAGTLTLHELEKKHILETLMANNQNRTKTAKVLGISIRTLRNKLKEYSTQ